MNKHRIAALWQGEIVRALLAHSRNGSIAGLTSHGVFINLDADWVLFLSYESLRGPLTLNLTGETSRLASLEVNDLVEIQGGIIQNLSRGVEIDFSRAEAWEAPPPSTILLSPGDRAGALKTVAGHILSQNKEPGLYLVLKDLLGLEWGDLPSPPKPFDRVDSAQLLQLFKTTDLNGILSTVTPLLGLGAGLTPAGDDMLLGLLLAYRRWRAVLRPAFNLSNLNDLLNQAASQKTTRLSANLIACASQGQADERLIQALDGIMTDHPAPDQCAHNLSTWGNSSGREALVGMALAILAACP